jgi:GNAT superfamily N-acetyltransferase
MNIVRASEKDLAELATLQRMYMEHHAKLDDYFTVEEDATARWIDYMRKSIEEKGNIVLVAFENNKIIGYMTASICSRPPVYKIKKVGLIGDSFVLPHYRRKGVLSKMLDEILSWMKTNSVEYVEHPIAVRNKLGRTVWKRKGFEDTTVLTKLKLS